MWCLSTKAPRCYTEAAFEDGCYLFFGKETRGLPEDFLETHRENCVRIPMRVEARSLNLSNSVAITVYEALRQLEYPNLLDHGKMRGQNPGNLEELQ
jgi:tRNA (cytidine/uridine-2'-O-)-methyltransferase